MTGIKARAVGLAGAGALVMVIALGPVLLPAAAHAAGFGATGIVAGSWAAALMRSYGGAVPSGSICAFLQRVGIKGVSTSTTAVIEIIAAAVAAALCAGYYHRYIKRESLSCGSPPQAWLLAEVTPERCPNLIDLGDMEEGAGNIDQPLLRQPILQIEGYERRCQGLEDAASASDLEALFHGAADHEHGSPDERDENRPAMIIIEAQA